MSTEIRSHLLANNMVLVAEPTTSMESAAFTFLVPAGCCYDPQGQHGLAAMTCELMLRGCGERNSREFISNLERLGVQRGESVGVSRSTWSGATVADQLFDALQIYADLLRRPRLPKDEVEPSRAVCMQELRAIEDEPAQKVMLELRRRHYADPWGRPSQGDHQSLQCLEWDQVQSFWQRYYRPNGTILGVAGAVDWDSLVDKVETLFGDWPPAEVPDIVDGPTGSRVTHLEMPSTQTQIGIAHPSIPYGHPDYFRAWGAVGVLSSGMSSRLFTEVREKRGLCYTISASIHTHRDRAALLCYSGTSTERAQETLDVAYEQLLKIGDGVYPQELDRLQARMKSGLVMQQESSSARSGALAREWYHLERARTLREIGAEVDALTADSINEYLAQNRPRQFSFVTLGAEPLEVPGEVS